MKPTKSWYEVVQPVIAEATAWRGGGSTIASSTSAHPCTGSVGGALLRTLRDVFDVPAAGADGVEGRLG